MAAEALMTHLVEEKSRREWREWAAVQQNGLHWCDGCMAYHDLWECQ